MPNPPRRRFFQIHLSTAIVLMFTIGALIWANTIEKISTTRPEFTVDATYTHSGWPFWAMNHVKFLDPYAIERFGKEDMYALVYFGVIENAIFALFVLFFVWLFCEWFIRRRSSKKGP